MNPADAEDGDRETGSQPIVVATKLQAPRVRDELIPRDLLVERLREGADRRLTLVACPAGFGKTTLLSLWRQAGSPDRPVAWVTLDDRDNDPVVLWSHVVKSLCAIYPGLQEHVTPDAVGLRPIDDVILPLLVNALDGAGAAALVLDDFHKLTAGPAFTGMAWFIDHAPTSLQLIVATRTEPSLRVSELRARGDLLELRGQDLRFSDDEAQQFLNDRLGLGLPAEEVEALVKRTEGWPAGLYLAALSLSQVEDRREFIRRFGASNRHVVDYLLTEVLEAHDPAMQELMVRCSVLPRFCGDLCDAVAEREGTAASLDALSRSNLFLVPLEDADGWYRFHHIFSAMLRAELERRDPGLASTLHRRAYAWHRERRDTDAAIDHALLAGAFAEAAELIESIWPGYCNVNRMSSLLAWLHRFSPEFLQEDVRLLHACAWTQAFAKDMDDAAMTIVRIEALGKLDDGPLSDGFSCVKAGIASLRSLILPSGDLGLRERNAKRVVELEGPDSPWRVAACLGMGQARFFRGDLDEADRWLAEAVESGSASSQWAGMADALAYRSMISGERGDPDRQQALASQAAAVMQRSGLEDFLGMVHTAAGLSLAVRGDPAAAVEDMAWGSAVLSRGDPILQTHALLMEAWVWQRLGDSQRVAAILAEADAVLASCRDAGALPARLSELEASMRRIGASTDRQHHELPLSGGELKVLRLLRTDLSEREIGRELYLSHNTIHSHTRSIYRKLGVQKRSDAVREARERGLI